MARMCGEGKCFKMEIVGGLEVLVASIFFSILARMLKKSSSDHPVTFSVEQLSVHPSGRLSSPLFLIFGAQY